MQQTSEEMAAGSNFFICCAGKIAACEARRAGVARQWVRLKRGIVFQENYGTFVSGARGAAV
jgi:hypothetical protein